jgi:hypothetical protein
LFDCEKFRRRKEKQRKRDFLGHEYTFWWEKLIGYIGYLFGF